MNPELLKAIDPYLRRVNLYSAYTLDGKEFVGSVEGELITTLRTNGYETAPTFLGVRLQAAKLHPVSGRVHTYSLRKVDPENNRKQYHIHLWDTGNPLTAEIYSHHEHRPDIRILEGETLADAIERLRTHYRPEWGESYIRGKADQTVRGLVE